MIKATVVGVLAQRLVRKICPHCRETFEIDHGELSSCGLDLGKSGSIKLARGKGCVKCRGTGYLGRSGVYEVLPVTDSIRRHIAQECSNEAVLDAARKDGMITLRENAVKKLTEGKTTYQEVLRVTWEQF
jgi:general secretion pathway protein E